jgi:hypothetical protein
VNSHAIGASCPKCGYRRQLGDTAPAWQCPACGVAMEKFRAQLAEVNRLATAVLVEEVPELPRLSLERRMVSAAPDLAMSSLFLWCWMAPAAWRPTLASELGLLMLMEFFALHSGTFLGGAVPIQQAGISTRIVTSAIVFAFYLPIAGAFAYFHGGWWPFLAFSWLLLSRVVSAAAGAGSGSSEAKRMRFYWGVSGSFYVLMAIPTIVVLPMPRLGFDSARGVFWDTWWNLRPYEVMAWGFFYFGAVAVVKLLEKPSWIEKQT